MKTSKAATVLLFCGIIAAAGVLKTDASDKVGKGRQGNRVPMIQATDLYHAHADPDDHFDLAAIYALDHWGLIDFKGVLIDYPSQPDLNDPDVMAVAQMNYYTGLSVLAVIGTSHLMKTRNDIAREAGSIDLQGIDWLMNTLRSSPAPVVVNIVGTATNVAIALKRDPELFRKKCRAIYLNSGSAYLDADKRMEYNVELNPSAYAAIFDAPCPVYWLPCFHMVNKGVGEFGTYYQFLQGDILPYVPEKLQNFFLFMLDRKTGNNWFSYLNGKPEAELLSKYGKLMRNMWSTAGFLHAAGKKVTPDGEIVDLGSDQKSVFSFLPVDVACSDEGVTTWKLNRQSTKRFIFHIDDLAKYQSAMTIALKNLYMHLPE
jgi:hypothetical protein